MLEKYNLENAIKVLKNPKYLLNQPYKEDLYLFALRINAYVSRILYSESNYRVMDEDWDNLLILDASRPEILEQVIPPNWDFSTRISNSSESWEFIQKNFLGKQYHDTIYVTANPYSSKIPDQTFYKILNLLDSGWDPSLGTVPPKTVAKTSLETHDKFQNKRLIVHFMQPHYPFIGASGNEIPQASIGNTKNNESSGKIRQPWLRKMIYKDIDGDVLINAYKENHKVVIDVVQKLIPELRGKTVITADHANLLGERTYPIPIATFGHPAGLRKRELLEVPWIEFEGDRRDITINEPIASDSIDDEIVKSRLSDLGYLPD